MVSLINIVLNEEEENLPATTVEYLPSTKGHTTDLNTVRGLLADYLGLELEDVAVGKVPAKCQDPENMKQVMMDYMDMGKSGDIYANFNIRNLDTDEIVKKLGGFLFEIEVNGCSGYDLSAIVSDGRVLAGNLVITSKTTEAEIMPFMQQMGENVSPRAFEHYWNGIGGKIIGQQELVRIQQRLMQIDSIRPGRQIRGTSRRMLNR